MKCPTDWSSRHSAPRPAAIIWLLVARTILSSLSWISVVFPAANLALARFGLRNNQFGTRPSSVANGEATSSVPATDDCFWANRSRYRNVANAPRLWLMMKTSSGRLPTACSITDTQRRMFGVKGRGSSGTTTSWPRACSSDSASGYHSPRGLALQPWTMTIFKGTLLSDSGAYDRSPTQPGQRLIPYVLDKCKGNFTIFLRTKT